MICAQFIFAVTSDASRVTSNTLEPKEKKTRAHNSCPISAYRSCLSFSHVYTLQPDDVHTPHSSSILWPLGLGILGRNSTAFRVPSTAFSIAVR